MLNRKDDWTFFANSFSYTHKQLCYFKKQNYKYNSMNSFLRNEIRNRRIRTIILIKKGKICELPLQRALWSVRKCHRSGTWVRRRYLHVNFRHGRRTFERRQIGDTWDRQACTWRRHRRHRYLQQFTCHCLSRMNDDKPMLCCKATRAFGTWRFPARPRSCHDSSTAWATPAQTSSSSSTKAYSGAIQK